MFETPSIRTALPLLVLKKLCLALIGAYLAIGLTAGYRAYHQIKSVDLRTPLVVKPESSIETSVVTYGRTFLDERVELIQGQQAETLSFHRIPNNRWAFLDPRTRRVSNNTMLSEDVLKRFQTGRAIVRLTVTGLPQLGHVPPPMVSEAAIEIQRD